MAKLDPRRRQCLEAMGIQVWELRGDSPPTPDARGPDTVHEERPPAPEVKISAGKGQEEPLDDPGHEGETEVARLDWEALQARVAACTACGLHKTRTQTVFGVGHHHADWMVVGEAPGADEDRQGEPFVGRAGQLLTAMLQASGFTRDAVYIANILKCRPPRNRDPEPDEVAHCEPFLHRQIALVQPQLILAVGRIAAQNLLKTDTPLGKLRGRVHRFGANGIPVVVTYHPAYLLRAPLEKRKAWQDLCLALEVSGQRIQRGSRGL